MAAFLSGGVIPADRRGSTTNTSLMYIADWYPTFCALAGVDATDDWVDPTTNETHPIDGVNLWPFLVAGDAGAVATCRVARFRAVSPQKRLQPGA